METSEKSNGATIVRGRRFGNAGRADADTVPPTLPIVANRVGGVSHFGQSVAKFSVFISFQLLNVLSRPSNFPALSGPARLIQSRCPGASELAVAALKLKLKFQ